MIVADDANLDIAHEHGFHTVDMGNADLGEKFNAGYQYGAEMGADLFVHIGSDDWLHPDALDIANRIDWDNYRPPGGIGVWSDGPTVVVQRTMTLVDLKTQELARCTATGPYGTIPWLIPRSTLEPSGFRPIPPGLSRGIDGALACSLNPRPNWIFQDGRDWLVDFKTSRNLTNFGVFRETADETSADPWAALSGAYPSWLIEIGRNWEGDCES